MSGDVREPDGARESKTQRKKLMAHAQELGEALLDLRPEQIVDFDLDERLLDALAEARRIRSREALRRQKQYIGKLMRNADLVVIEAKLEEIRLSHRVDTLEFRDVERLRDQLLQGGNDEIGDVIARYPGIDSQKLRQLVKRARQEFVTAQANVALESQGAPQAVKTARRALFRFLKEVHDTAAGHDSVDHDAPDAFTT